MNTVLQSLLQPAKILKVNILLALLLCLSQNRIEKFKALLFPTDEFLRVAVVPWAFSPSDLIYLIEQEEEFYVLIERYQTMARSEEQLQLVNRYTYI